MLSSRLFPGMKEVLDCRKILDVWRLGLGSRISGEVVFFACCMSFVWSAYHRESGTGFAKPEALQVTKH